MTTLLVTSHIRGEKLTLRVGDLGAEELQIAVERLAQHFAENLARPRDELWGVRILSIHGIFEFGNWSFDRLAGFGGALSANEPALAIFREWEEEARCDPGVALAATAELVRHCLLEDPPPRSTRREAQLTGRRRGAQCERRSIGAR